MHMTGYGIRFRSRCDIMGKTPQTNSLIKVKAQTGYFYHQTGIYAIICSKSQHLLIKRSKKMFGYNHEYNLHNFLEKKKKMLPQI